MTQTVNLAGFAAALRVAAAHIRNAERHGLDKGAALIADEARDLIGTEYAGWPELATSTVAAKERKGQTGRVSGTDPLLATGEFRATVGHEVEHPIAVVGTPDPVAVFLEEGTSRMPPRPVFAAAGHRKAKDAAKAVGEAVRDAVAGLPLR